MRTQALAAILRQAIGHQARTWRISFSEQEELIERALERIDLTGGHEDYVTTAVIPSPHPKIPVRWDLVIPHVDDTVIHTDTQRAYELRGDLLRLLLHLRAKVNVTFPEHLEDDYLAAWSLWRQYRSDVLKRIGGEWIVDAGAVKRILVEKCGVVGLDYCPNPARRN